MQYPARLALGAFLVVFAAPLQAQSANAEAATASPTAVVVPAAAASPSFVPSFAPADAAPLAAPTADRNAEGSSVAGAPLTGQRAGVHVRETNRPANAATAAAAHANLGQSRAMMAVGVAGLIVGAIIGGTPGTIIMVGGGLVGLLGLYDYLQ